LSAALIGHGFLVGIWSLLFAGALTGGLIELVYRTFRDVSFGGDGYFGMLKTVDSHLEHFLSGAIGAAIPALLVGMTFGVIQGEVSRRRNIGAIGVLVLSIVGAVFGLAGGLILIGSRRLARDFTIAPLPGLLFGSALFAVAGVAVRKLLNRLRARDSQAVIRWLRINAGISCIVIGAVAAIFPICKLGWTEFQIFMGSASVLSVGLGIYCLSQGRNVQRTNREDSVKQPLS
jgi:hypothetical protein